MQEDKCLMTYSLEFEIVLIIVFQIERGILCQLSKPGHWCLTYMYSIGKSIILKTCVLILTLTAKKK